MRVIGFILVLLIVGVSCQISCLNEKGQPVDWFWMLKLGNSVGLYKGYTYAYFDSNSNGEFLIGDIRNSTNSVAHTVKQLGLYGSTVDKSKVGYVLYNDQTYDTIERNKVINHDKDSTGNYFAHAKGFFAFDNSKGIWMVHSAPGFPFNHTITPSSWTFPYSQTIYAQSFFCATVKLSNIDQIAGLLHFHYPYIYDSNLPASMASSFPQVSSLIQKNKKSGFSFISIATNAGKELMGLSKSSDSNSDLYEDFISPTLSVPLKVETWCGGTYGNNCTKTYCKGSPIVNPSSPQKNQQTYAYDSANINQMYFANNLYFKTEYNHAKWAIAYQKGTERVDPWFCASDINTMLSQRRRGGGALCMIDAPLWNKINSFVVRDYDKTCEK